MLLPVHFLQYTVIFCGCSADAFDIYSFDRQMYLPKLNLKVTIHNLKFNLFVYVLLNRTKKVINIDLKNFQYPIFNFYHNVIDTKKQDVNSYI